jgi:hypothetical protein
VPAVLAAAGLSLAVAEAAAAAPAPPPAIRVDGGAESWRADPGFTLRWDNPPAEPPIAAVHYRLSWPDGTTVREERIAGSSEMLDVPLPNYVRGI